MVEEEEIIPENFKCGVCGFIVPYTPEYPHLDCPVCAEREEEEEEE